MRSAVQQLKGMEPATVARQVAVVRVGIGVVATLVPGVLGIAVKGGRLTPEAAVLARMLGARDLAMGLGAVMAARRGPGALRTWAEAGALADAIDAVVMARSTGFRPTFRLLSGASAVSAAVIGVWTTTRLPER